jgi:hypothetical protein
MSSMENLLRAILDSSPIFRLRKGLEMVCTLGSSLRSLSLSCAQDEALDASTWQGSCLRFFFKDHRERIAEFQDFQLLLQLIITITLCD